MPFDKTKNQRKGFCFITFESEQVVNELLKTPKQTIKDKEVSNIGEIVGTAFGREDANISWKSIRKLLLL